VLQLASDWANPTIGLIGCVTKPLNRDENVDQSSKLYCSAADVVDQPRSDDISCYDAQFR